MSFILFACITIIRCCYLVRDSNDPNVIYITFRKGCIFNKKEIARIEIIGQTVDHRYSCAITLLESAIKIKEVKEYLTSLTSDQNKAFSDISTGTISGEDKDFVSYYLKLVYVNGNLIGINITDYITNPTNRHHVAEAYKCRNINFHYTMKIARDFDPDLYHITDTELEKIKTKISQIEDKNRSWENKYFEKIDDIFHEEAMSIVSEANEISNQISLLKKKSKFQILDEDKEERESHDATSNDPK